MAARYRVEVHEQVLRAEMARIGWRFTRRLLEDVQDNAKRLARGGPYSTGRLAASIYKHGPRTTGWVTRGEVGTHLSYAPAVERGTGLYGPKERAYDIFPKGATREYRFGDRRRPQLRFVWRGRVVYTPHVPMASSTVKRSHPGQRGKHFLIRGMIQAAVKHRVALGIRVRRE